LASVSQITPSVIANLTTPILTAPCRLASSLLRVDTTSSNTGSPLSISSRTRSHCHKTSQSPPFLLPMPLLPLLLKKAPAAFDENLFLCGR